MNTITISNGTNLDILEERVSDWNKMKRVMALVLRFTKICRKQLNTKTTRLQVDKIEEAGQILIKMAQQKYLSEKIVRQNGWLSSIHSEM